MMRRAFTILFLVIVQFHLRAQERPDRAAMDSSIEAAILLNDTARTKETAFEQYLHVQDSVYRAVVGSYVDARVKEGEYNWPWSLWHSYPADTAVPTLTQTWAYGLEKEHGIDPNGIGSGCVGEDWYNLYDSLMKAAIEARYGADFFVRTRRRAGSLDAAGAGLRLPYIKHPDSTAAVLRRHLGYIDALPVDTTSPFSQRNEAGRYLFISFKNGQLHRVSAGIQVFGIQTDMALLDRSDEFTTAAKKLPWTGPRYAGRGATATVVFSFRTGNMFFQQ